MPQQDGIPKLRPRALSSYVADLLLVGAGEGEAMKHRQTRGAWHLFFFSMLTFLAWHVLVRLLIAPSFYGSPRFLVAIRTFEAAFYGYLLLTLAALAYYHYHFMLLPRRDPRFVTIAFFFVMTLLLFGRLHYSLFHVKPALYRWAASTIIPTPEFGVHGYTDIAAFGEFVIFSGCSLLNCSLSNLQANSLLVALITLVQVITGYVFIAIVISTFVQVQSTISKDS
jgi:hypothetical protein